MQQLRSAWMEAHLVTAKVELLMTFTVGQIVYHKTNDIPMRVLDFVDDLVLTEWAGTDGATYEGCWKEFELDTRPPDQQKPRLTLVKAPGLDYQKVDA